MKTTVSTLDDFKKHWAGPLNFLMEGECVPFEFDLPPLEEVVDLLRRDSDTNIGSGRKGDKILLDSIAADFRAMPLDKAVASSFSIAHYSLGRFDVPGKFLHGFERRVLNPWRNALKAQGFSFDRLLPDHLHQRPELCDQLPHGFFARDGVADLRHETVLRPDQPQRQNHNRRTRKVQGGRDWQARGPARR